MKNYHPRTERKSGYKLWLKIHCTLGHTWFAARPWVLSPPEALQPPRSGSPALAWAASASSAQSPGGALPQEQLSTAAWCDVLKGSRRGQESYKQ